MTKWSDIYGGASSYMGASLVLESVEAVDDATFTLDAGTYCFIITAGGNGGGEGSSNQKGGNGGEIKYISKYFPADTNIVFTVGYGGAKNNGVGGYSGVDGILSAQAGAGATGGSNGATGADAKLDEFLNVFLASSAKTGGAGYSTYGGGGGGLMSIKKSGDGFYGNSKGGVGHGAGGGSGSSGRSGAGADGALFIFKLRGV